MPSHAKALPRSSLDFLKTQRSINISTRIVRIINRITDSNSIGLVTSSYIYKPYAHVGCGLWLRRVGFQGPRWLCKIGVCAALSKMREGGSGVWRSQ
jgi:hypothetical protein